MASGKAKIWDPLRKTQVPLTPEEEVRQWFIGVLSESYGVPKHLMMSEVSLKFGDKDYRADIVVYDRELKPVMMVECKSRTVSLDRKVLEQVLRYSLTTDVKFIVITNGNATFAFSRLGDGSFRQLVSFPDWNEMLAASKNEPAEGMVTGEDKDEAPSE